MCVCVCVQGTIRVMTSPDEPPLLDLAKLFRPSPVVVRPHACCVVVHCDSAGL